jgi:hypothetical protein
MDLAKVIKRFFIKLASMLLLNGNFEEQPNLLFFDLIESFLLPLALDLAQAKSAL